MLNEYKKQQNVIIEDVLETGDCLVVDLFPKQIQSFEKYKSIELYLLRKNNRKLYAQKIVEFLWRIIPYYDCYVWFDKSDEDYFICDKTFVKFEKQLKKRIIQDKIVDILIQAYNIVIHIQLNNTSIHFKNHQEILLIKETAERVGFFVWQPVEKNVNKNNL